MIRIRAIASADAETWDTLRSALWPGDHRDEVAAFFRGALEEPLAVLFAEDETGAVLGFVELSIRNAVPGAGSDRVGYVEGLYVVPARRGTGVTAALLAASKDWAHTLGCGAFASDRADRVVVDSGFRARYRHRSQP